MNYLDIAVVAIIFGLGIISYCKGFVKACLGFLPIIGAVFGAYITYPTISKFLRGGFIYTKIADSIHSRLGIESALGSTFSSQNEIINSINAPGFIKNALINNNNSVVYDILDVSGIEEYISGFIANVCINILSLVAAFVVIFVIIKLIIHALDLIADIPFIGFINRSFGFAVGIIKGTVIVWIIGIILTFFYYNEAFAGFFKMLNDSRLALFMYENNYLLFMILKIFT